MTELSRDYKMRFWLGGLAAFLVLLYLLRGGSDVNPNTLSRFYEFHIGVLPTMMTLLIVAHVLLVRLHGRGSAAKRSEPRNLSVLSRPYAAGNDCRTPLCTADLQYRSPFFEWLAVMAQFDFICVA